MLFESDGDNFHSALVWNVIGFSEDERFVTLHHTRGKTHGHGHITISPDHHVGLELICVASGVFDVS